MISDVKKAFENSTVSELAKMMIKHDISHVPVVDASNRLKGMITDIDLMSCLD
jgi:CBS domain-containing protein